MKTLTLSHKLSPAICGLRGFGLERDHLRQSRFTEAQIVGILKELKAAAKAADLCRTHSISEATLYAWRSEFGNLETSDLVRLKQLGEENRRLKNIVADQALNIEALKIVAEGHF